MESINSMLTDFTHLLKRRELSLQKSLDRSVKLLPKRQQRQDVWDSKDFNVKFQHFNDIYNTKVFVDNFQRPALVEPNVTYVTLEDIKDVVLFTAIYDLPKDFVKLFLSDHVDRFLRALLLYMQHFLDVFQAVVKRREAVKATKLRHPISGCVETFWKETLSILRFIVAREYCQILMGTNEAAEFHHFDKKTHLSRQVRDLTLHQLLHIFARRTIEIALHEKGNVVIEEEMNRLFLVGVPPVDRKKKYGLVQMDIVVLEHDFTVPCLRPKSAIIKEFFRPNRIALLKTIGQKPWLSRDETPFFLAIELALAGGESCFGDANVRLGILGYERREFDCLLDIQIRVKTDNKSTTTSEAESAAAVMRIFVDKTVPLTGPAAVIPKRDENFEYNFDENFLGRCQNYNEQHMAIRKKKWIVFRKMNSRVNYDPSSEKQFKDEPVSKNVKFNLSQQRETKGSMLKEKNSLPSFFFKAATKSDMEDDVFTQFHEGFMNELVEKKKKAKYNATCP